MSLIMAAQEKTVNACAVACEIYHTIEGSRCRLCMQHQKTVDHLTSECSKLAETYYTKRHNYAASIVYKAICAVYKLQAQ